MEKATNGDTVRVHYTAKLEDGAVLGTSEQGKPLEFTLGDSSVIQGLQDAVRGMTVGESKTTSVAPDQGFGPHRKDLVFEVERATLPPNIDPEVGQRLEYRHPNSQPIPIMVTDVSESTVTLDSNHPLAGRELTFDLELVEITATAG